LDSILGGIELGTKEKKTEVEGEFNESSSENVTNPSLKRGIVGGRFGAW